MCVIECRERWEERGKSLTQIIKLSINHKERKTNVLCFAQTSITSGNLADSSHWTGALAAVQSQKCAHHSAPIKGTKGPPLALKRISNIPCHCHQCPYQVCGFVRVKPSLETAYRPDISQGCRYGAKRTNSKINYGDGHGLRHVKPTELCLTRNRTNELSLQIATHSKYKQQI